MAIAALLAFAISSQLAGAAGPKRIPGKRIPGKNGVFTACYTAKSGLARLVPTATRCRPGERKVRWQQQGKAGPAGTPGPVGPVGPGGAVTAYALCSL